MLRRLSIMAGGSCVLLACTGLALAIAGPGASAWKSVGELQKPDEVSTGTSHFTASPKETKAPAVTMQGAAAAVAHKVQPASIPYGTELTPSGIGFYVMRVGDAAESGTREVMPEPCPAGTLFSQRCATYDDEGGSAAFSDFEMGAMVFENFWDVRGVISGLSWYGVFVDENFSGCGNDPREFDIRFYEDASGTPGAEIAAYYFTVTGEPTDMDVAWYAFATRYTVELDPPIELQEGWVSIVGAGDPDGCVFAWMSDPMTDPPGDGHYCYVSEGEFDCQGAGDPWSCDFNLCVLGTFYSGACCDDVTGLCQDGIEYADCLEPSRFEAGMLCNEMDPPCGQITGACCEGETCQIRTPGECLSVGGIYKGDYVPCDPNPCTGGCCVGNGVCEVHTELDCVALGGDYHGDGTGCNPNTCPPANDDCANPEPVTEGEWPFDTTYATLDGPQACDIGPNAWFCYTASATGTVTLQVKRTSEPYWPPVGAAYQGCACDPFPALIICGSYGEGETHFDFDVQAGAQYLIEVGILGGGGGGERTVSGGPGTLTLSLDPWQFGACCTDESPYCFETYEPLCTGTFAGDGTTCDPTDCNGSGFPDACDIAKGLSEDCNANGVPDECDLTAGTSTDYDLNGVPDECDPDCNGNGIVDACDIDCYAGNCNQVVGCGESGDCQADGIPDECQLGGLGGEDTLLWDNGLPGHEDADFLPLASQVGGAYSDIIVVDDFFLTEGARVNTFHAYFDGDSWFDWTGRVRIEVYPDNGEGGPDESGGPTALLWVPTDGGSVTQTYTGASAVYNDGFACRYDVTDIDIELGPGIWWIGMASETASLGGTAGWASSRSGGTVVMGQAHARTPEFIEPIFMPASMFWCCTTWDVSFSVGTTVSGADCNDNMIPDSCDIAYCDGATWCGDCNVNGVPDACDIANGESNDCNGNGIPDDCELCGDLDSDGDVDYDDYVIFLEAFGGVTDGVPAVDYCCDYDGSGAVGMADFDAWLSCYRAYVNDPLAGPPTVGKRRIRVPLSPLPKRGLGPVPSP